MVLNTNGGTHHTDLIGDIPNFGPVQYSEKSLANVLSLAAVRKKFRVTMDKEKEPTFLVHKGGDKVLKFAEYKNGLHLHDKNDPNMEVCLVQIVKGNIKNFHRKDVDKAKQARELYIALGRPSFKKYLHILDKNHIPNCIVT